MSDSDPTEQPEWLRSHLQPSSLSAAAALRSTSSNPPSPPAAPEKSTVAKLAECDVFGRKILAQTPFGKASAVQWLRRVRNAFLQAFGPQSNLVKSLDLEIKSALQPGLTPQQFADKVNEVEGLSHHLEAFGASPLALPSSQPCRPPSTTSVFIIHGHDELNTRRLEKLLSSEFKLNPIVILARPGMTRPLTDKFEDDARKCSFAFALFTPDDQIQKPKESYGQARPNVIYEVGWFAGRLGKERVALLLKEGTKIHSDLDGVSQIRFEDNIESKFLEIQRELQAAKLVR